MFKNSFNRFCSMLYDCVCNSKMFSHRFQKIRFLLIIGLVLFEINGNKCISLDSHSDNIMQLNAQNFNQIISEKNSILIVNFYIDWCPNCISFEPRYNQFARDISNWHPIIKVASLNCWEPQNLDLCQNRSITSFPKVKVFFLNYGQQMNASNSNAKTLRYGLIDFLLSHQNSFTYRLNIFPINVVTKAELLNAVSITSDKHYFVFIEINPSYLGVEIILDFSQYADSVQIYRVYDKTNTLVKTLFNYFVGLPVLVKIDNNLNIDLIASAHSQNEEFLRNEFRESIKRSLKLYGLKKNGLKQTATRELNEKRKPKTVYPTVTMVDLYSTLKYSLNNEVKRFSKLNHTQIAVLKQYFSLIYKYFPFDNENVRRFFKRMNNWWANKKNNLKIDSLMAQMKISDGYMKPYVEWRHCNGSKPHLRGFPCGVWVLFHVMTVREYKFSKDNQHEVVTTMKDYINNFFTCDYCAKQFDQTSKNIELNLKNREDSVLWLWRIHNQINMRLHSNISEDPWFPKLQFPTQALCPNCSQLNGEYNENNVLQYLVHYYGGKLANNSCLLCLSNIALLFSILGLIIYSLFYA